MQEFQYSHITKFSTKLALFRFVFDILFILASIFFYILVNCNISNFAKNFHTESGIILTNSNNPISLKFPS